MCFWINNFQKLRSWYVLSLQDNIQYFKFYQHMIIKVSSIIPSSEAVLHFKSENTRWRTASYSIISSSDNAAKVFFKWKCKIAGGKTRNYTTKPIFHRIKIFKYERDGRRPLNLVF